MAIEREQRLDEVWSGWIGSPPTYQDNNGLFYYMSTDNEAIDKYNLNGAFDDYSSMDAMYISERSGNKQISHLIYNMLKAKELAKLNTKIEDSDAKFLKNIVLSKYGEKWGLILKNLKYDYDATKPINTKKIEIGHNKGTDDKTNSGGTTNTKSGSENSQNNGTLSRDITGNPQTENELLESNIETKNNKNAFNDSSLIGSPQDNSRTTENNKSITKDRLDEHSIETDTRGITKTYNEVKDTFVDTRKELTVSNSDNNTNITYSGNDGTTSYTDLVDDELNLRLKWNFWDVVFKDVDSVLVDNIFIE